VCNKSVNEKIKKSAITQPILLFYDKTATIVQISISLSLHWSSIKEDKTKRNGKKQANTQKKEEEKKKNWEAERSFNFLFFFCPVAPRPHN